MKAFLLAAGLGQRLRPLTEHLPKPLVPVGGKPLIFWHIEKLRDAGIYELVINCHWLAGQLMDALGDGSSFDVSIQWSQEVELLNTGGGIRAALPYLHSDEPFALISADIWSDFDYRWFLETNLGTNAAQLVMVESPPFNAAGDFGVDSGGMLRPADSGEPVYTYSGIGVLDPSWVREWPGEGAVFPLLTPLQKAVRARRIKAMLHGGLWTDVGTTERLEQLRGNLRSDQSPAI